MGFDYQEYLASREWALLKNMVRQRSGGTCERCHRAPHQSTHHKTYARIGHELLEDLLGVCNPCHEWLSGKRDDDPALSVSVAAPVTPTRPRPILNSNGDQARVYLAGKIAKYDWRHELFPSLSWVVTEPQLNEWNSWPDKSFNHQAPIIDPEWVEIAEIERDGLLYGGPYFVGQAGGQYHGEATHGQIKECSHPADACAEVPAHQCDGMGISRRQITESCLNLIRRCDYVFCWLGANDAYGSIYELGYAEALNKPVFLGMPSLNTGIHRKLFMDSWFARERSLSSGEYHASGGFRTSKTPLDAWNSFVTRLRAGVPV